MFLERGTCSPKELYLHRWGGSECGGHLGIDGERSDGIRSFGLVQRLAGHVEAGRDSVTDPAIGA